jgi:two-component system OmpR family sensor kinase
MKALDFKTRLWLGHVAVLTIMLAAAAFGADLALRRLVLGQVIDDALVSLASTEAAALQRETSVRVHEMAPGAGPPSFVRLDKFVQIIDLEGRVLARSVTLGTSRLPAPPALLARLRGGETVFATVTDFGEEPVRMVALPVDLDRGRHGIQVAMSLDDAHAVLAATRWLFLGMSLVMLTGIGLTGAVLARRALRPIDEMAAHARRIGEANLGERLVHPGTRDEIGRLTETLNAMLERLELSFEVQRRFTADASHELRSPISRLRAELEVTLRRPRTIEQYQEALRSCLEEVHRVQALIEELLELARIDARQEAEPPKAFAVREILDAAVARVSAAAADRRIAIGVEAAPELLVNASAGATELAVVNILDNAVKFSAPGGKVRIIARAAADEVAITISDTGPGVSSEDAPRLFERFYRGKASRAADVEGFGLGLAISRALVERQGGRIAVEDTSEQGATFTVRLPRGS